MKWFRDVAVSMAVTAGVMAGLGGIYIARVPAGDTLSVPSQTQVEEDDPSWNCAVDGNRVCGPDNQNGVPAGCYNAGGDLVAVWPCYIP